ncbi:EAL and modified HD-GYP domain-containing signal transduction protein [Duganella sacchari]|uniref:EAL and modified HD-GYP domain-containing signal transduction protein n=1 Tax=Duganella sacchari TaxID=551987 RepID=A0A1M7NM01_9BURK|nr:MULTISPECIES: EAL domain-containing protein [Duganella]MYM27497.1 EAL domain-containing protein [Duganella sp. CY15W]SHN04963.1 EAL and modified HD-GYP domain-containing signal transduction protein [Duganella sacchari]
MMLASSPASSRLADNFFLARQPILNRGQRLVAYELLFRDAGSYNGAHITDDTEATATVIAHASELGMGHVVGDQMAFVNVDAVGLMSDFIRFLPNDKVILEILETVKATPEVLERIRELKQAGFKFALDDVIGHSEDVQKFTPLCDVIKVDIKDMQPGTLPALAKVLKNPKQKLLAEKVETVEEFQQCMELGFEYFQGYYFARPVILSGKKISPSQLSVLNLLDLLDRDASNQEIEASVKHDALITLNLLRLVNTPAVGARQRINSVGHALMVLGRRQLRRWLQILLYVKNGGTQEFTSPLLQLATTRGKTMELIVEQRKPGQRVSADIGFTVGVMSLMDTLFSIHMRDVLESVNVLDEVRAALLHRSGDYGAMLSLIEHVERGRDGKVLAQMLHQLDLRPAELYAIQLAAIEWVTEYTRGI